MDRASDYESEGRGFDSLRAHHPFCSRRRLGLICSREVAVKFHNGRQPHNRFVGVIAGWLAGKIVRGTGFGIVADLCIGIVGALIGGWLLPRLGIHVGTGLIAAIASATVGAVVLLIVLGLFRRRRQRRWW